jgi:hypothetical protein
MRPNRRCSEPRVQGSGSFKVTVRRGRLRKLSKSDSSTGHLLLDQAGFAALRTWRFPRGAPNNNPCANCMDHGDRQRIRSSLATPTILKHW